MMTDQTVALTTVTSEEEKFYLSMPEKHKVAFEFYYSLGPDRDLQAVATKYGVSNGTCYKWSSKYKWNRLIDWRNSRVQEKVDEGVVAKMAEAVTEATSSIIERNRTFVVGMREMLETLIEAAKKDIATGRIKVMDVYQLRTIMEMEMMISDMELRMSKVAESPVLDRITSLTAENASAEAIKALNRIMDLRRMAIDQVSTPTATSQSKITAIQTALKAEEQFRRLLLLITGQDSPDGVPEELADKTEEELDELIRQKSASLQKVGDRILKLVPPKVSGE